MSTDNVSAQKEIRDIQAMRKQLGMKPLELTTRQCLKCDAEIFVFKCSDIWMCKNCKAMKECQEDNQTY